MIATSKRPLLALAPLSLLLTMCVASEPKPASAAPPSAPVAATAPAAPKETGGYEASSTAILLVDPYNDFMSEGGKLFASTKESRDLVHTFEHMKAILDKAREGHIQVFVVPHHRATPGDLSTWRYPTPFQLGGSAKQAFAAGSWGGQFATEYGPKPGDIVVYEHFAQSGFANTNLDQQLKQHGITHLVLIGMIANSCIESTARWGMEIGYHVTLVPDATAAFSADGMAAAATNGKMFAHAILPTSELLPLLP